MAEQKDKCPDCKGTGKGQFHHNRNAACDTCNGTGEKKLVKPLKDASEVTGIVPAGILQDCSPDRKAIQDILDTAITVDDNCKVIPKVDQIMALFESRIKEAKQEAWTRYRSGHLTALSIAVEEVKTQERDRVLGILIKEYPAIATWKCWPDLKDGK